MASYIIGFVSGVLLVLLGVPFEWILGVGLFVFALVCISEN